MLHFKAPGFEAQFCREREKVPHDLARNLQIFLAVCWVIGLGKYVPALYDAEMSNGSTMNHMVLVVIQIVMVAFHAWAAWQLQKDRRMVLDSLSSEDLKFWANIAEMSANMVCTILDNNAVRQFKLDFFPPAVQGPTIQCWFPILDGVRLSVLLPLQGLRCMTFAWMEMDAIVRYLTGPFGRGAGISAILPKVLYDVSLVAAVGIVLPLIITAVLEVRVRRAFLLRWGKPLDQLGPFWSVIHAWAK